jgi:cytochrome b561
MITNTKASWGLFARAFHWILGITIIGMLAYGYWMDHLAPRPDRLFYRQIHADIGYVVLLLMVLRLAWRVFNPTPALPAGTPLLERAAAHIVHSMLYLATFVVACLGWAHSGAHNPDYGNWFGLFHVPQFTTENREVSLLYEERHIQMAYVLLALVVLHALAALFHHVVKRDRILMRMIDGKPG